MHVNDKFSRNSTLRLQPRRAHQLLLLLLLFPGAKANANCTEWEVVTAPTQTIDRWMNSGHGEFGTCIMSYINYTTHHSVSIDSPGGNPLFPWGQLKDIKIHKCGNSYVPFSATAVDIQNTCPGENEEGTCLLDSYSAELTANGILTLTLVYMNKNHSLGVCDSPGNTYNGPVFSRTHAEGTQTHRINLASGNGRIYESSLSKSDWNNPLTSWRFGYEKRSELEPYWTRNYATVFKGTTTVPLQLSVMTPSWHASPRRAIERIAVDGASEASIEVTAPSSDPIELELRLNGVVATNGQAGTLTTTRLVPVDKGSGRFVAQTTYAPPETIPRGSAALPTVTIATRNLSQNTSAKIRLVAPPVLTLHGVWSNDAAWSRLRTFLGYRYPTETMLAGYGLMNARSFGDPTMAGRVRFSFDYARDQLLNRRLLATRFDVVAHSMGALAVLAAAKDTENYYRGRNRYRGDVLRLIGVGSPMNGSELATFLATHRNAPPDGSVPWELRMFGCPTDTLGTFMACRGMPLSCGAARCAVDALAVGSSELSQISAIPNVPVLGVSTTAPPESIVERALDRVLATYDPQAINRTVSDLLRPSGPAHDTIVGIQSQNSLASRTFVVSGVVHASPLISWTQTADERVFHAILCHLRDEQSCAIPSAHVIKSPSGFPSLVEINVGNRTEVDAALVALEPPDGSPLLLGIEQPVALRAVNGAIEGIYMVAADGTGELIADGSPARLRPTTLNDAALRTVVLLSGNRFAIVSANYPVTAAATPDNLSLDPYGEAVVLTQGDVFAARVLAEYGSFVVDATSEAEISVVRGNEIVAVESSSASIVATGLGTATVRYGVRGKTIDLEVRVGSPFEPSIFADSFDE